MEPSKTPELAALEAVCSRLDAAAMAYMLTGSLAMSYYARPRMTRDIDLVIALEATRVPELERTLGEEFHVDTEAIGAALREFRPWNIIHLPSLVKIDLIPRKASVYRGTEFERRRRVDLAGVELWIVSVEDLILSKLEWMSETGSAQQRGDLKALLGILLDRAYLEFWAGQLGLERLLLEIEGE
jgi:predicted nucleotidyltransferase